MAPCLLAFDDFDHPPPDLHPIVHVSRVEHQHRHPRVPPDVAEPSAGSVSEFTSRCSPSWSIQTTLVWGRPLGNRVVRTAWLGPLGKPLGALGQHAATLPTSAQTRTRRMHPRADMLAS